MWEVKEKEKRREGNSCDPTRFFKKRKSARSKNTKQRGGGGGRRDREEREIERREKR